MIYKQVLESILKNKEAKANGKHTGIPYPFPRLTEYIPVIERGQSIGILAGTGVGKSKFTRFVYLYHVYSFAKATKYPVKVLYFPLEDNKEKVYHNLICYYLKAFHGIIVSMQELKSQKSELPDFVVEKIEEAVDYFAELETIVKFYDGVHTPSKIYDICKEEALRHGKPVSTVNEEGVKTWRFQPSDDIHLIVLLDNMSNLDTDEECPTERDAMTTLAKTYVREKMCNFFNMTVVQVMQLAFDKERQQFTNTGMSIISKLEPSLDGVGDAKTMTRSMHLVIGIFNPSRYELINYPLPSKDDPENCYRIDLLGNRFRAIKILKSNDSDVGMRIGLKMDALAEMFEELPLPKTPEIKELYNKLTKNTGKSFVPSINKITFAEDFKDDEDPF